MKNRQELLDYIQTTPPLDAILKLVQDVESDDASHNLGHTLRVALWTLHIGQNELDPRLAITAALLHDFVNVPKDSPDRARASQLCADHVRTLLPEHGFTPQEIDLIADAIRDHSFSRGATPTTFLGKALQDADRLEALGAIGLMRTFATGQRMGANFFHAEDPWGHTRDLNDTAFSVDHFFTKLLKLPNTMLTEAGRAEGHKRAQVLAQFLRQLGDEIGEPMPE